MKPRREPLAPIPPYRVDGAALYLARQAAGYTKAEFGRALGVSGTAVWLWERSERMMCADRLMRAGRILGIDPLSLLTNEPLPSTQDVA